MPQFIKVAQRSDVPDGTGKCVKIESKQIALFNVEGNRYAIDETCTHRGGPLSDGSIDGFEIEYPRHGAHFNIKSGQITSAPAGADVSTYKVRIAGDDMEVEG